MAGSLHSCGPITRNNLGFNVMPRNYLIYGQEPVIDHQTCNYSNRCSTKSQLSSPLPFNPFLTLTYRSHRSWLKTHWVVVESLTLFVSWWFNIRFACLTCKRLKWKCTSCLNLHRVASIQIHITVCKYSHLPSFHLKLILMAQSVTTQNFVFLLELLPLPWLWGRLCKHSK